MGRDATSGVPEQAGKTDIINGAGTTEDLRIHLAYEANRPLSGLDFYRAGEALLLAAGGAARGGVATARAPGRTPRSNTPNSPIYEVGLANALRRNPVPGTQVNHTPQSREAELLLGDFNPRNRVGNEPAIRLPISEHTAVSAAQRARGAQASARDLLADEIRVLRNNTQAPNSTLQRLIDLSQRRHPADYAPLHRTSP